MTRGRAQYSISLKVSQEQKRAFAKRCANAGISQSEMLDRCLFGRLPDEQPLPVVAREQIILIHQLRAASEAGIPIDAGAMAELIASTRELIATIRVSFA